MRYCLCGNVAIENGAECARCRALRVLGLQPDASDKEIRTAYHVLVKVWHPDRFQNDQTLSAEAEEKLKEINSAFSYLTSDAARQESARKGQRPTRPRAYDYPSPAAEDLGTDETAAVPQPEPVRAKGSGWVRFLMAIVFSSIARTFAFIAAFALIGLILFRPIDKFLTSEPLTAATYGQFKTDMQRGLWGAGTIVSGYFSEMWQGHDPQKKALPALSGNASAPQREPGEPSAQESVKVQSNASPAETVKILPYVTAGLSKDEVIAVQGPPSSTSEGKFIYGHSELYFKDNKLVGWKIDPESPPIRVKLWPDAAVDPDLDSFWMGSSKNEVLVVQGTPTFWSEDTFGYGGSEVYFKNGKVVNWKNDPASVPLRAKRR